MKPPNVVLGMSCPVKVHKYFLPDPHYSLLKCLLCLEPHRPTWTTRARLEPHPSPPPRGRSCSAPFVAAEGVAA